MRRARMFRQLAYPLALAALVALGVAGAAMFGAGPAASAAQETRVVLVPPSQARTGELVTVRLLAQNAHNLAGFQATVLFDPSRLRLTGATIEPGLKASGRDMLKLGPVLRDGSAVLGAATCPVANCSGAPASPTVRLLNGVDGQVELGTISFYIVTPGRYELKLDGVQLIDPQGKRLTTAATNAALIVTSS